VFVHDSDMALVRAGEEWSRTTYRAYSDMLKVESSLSYWVANWSWGEMGADIAASGADMLTDVEGLEGWTRYGWFVWIGMEDGWMGGVRSCG
jgi:hypothetical protein